MSLISLAKSCGELYVLLGNLFAADTTCGGALLFLSVLIMFCRFVGKFVPLRYFIISSDLTKPPISFSKFLNNLSPL